MAFHQSPAFLRQFMPYTSCNTTPPSFPTNQPEKQLCEEAVTRYRSHQGIPLPPNWFPSLKEICLIKAGHLLNRVPHISVNDSEKLDGHLKAKILQINEFSSHNFGTTKSSVYPEFKAVLQLNVPTMLWIYLSHLKKSGHLEQLHINRSLLTNSLAECNNFDCYQILKNSGIDLKLGLSEYLRMPVRVGDAEACFAILKEEPFTQRSKLEQTTLVALAAMNNHLPILQHLLSYPLEQINIAFVVAQAIHCGTIESIRFIIQILGLEKVKYLVTHYRSVSARGLPVFAIFLDSVKTPLLSEELLDVVKLICSFNASVSQELALWALSEPSIQHKSVVSYILNDIQFTVERIHSFIVLLLNKAFGDRNANELFLAYLQRTAPQALQEVIGREESQKSILQSIIAQDSNLDARLHKIHVWFSISEPLLSQVLTPDLKVEKFQQLLLFARAKNYHNLLQRCPTLMLDLVRSACAATGSGLPAEQKWKVVEQTGQQYFHQLTAYSVQPVQLLLDLVGVALAETKGLNFLCPALPHPPQTEAMLNLLTMLLCGALVFEKEADHISFADLLDKVPHPDWKKLGLICNHSLLVLLVRGEIPTEITDIPYFASSSEAQGTHYAGEAETAAKRQRIAQNPPPKLPPPILRPNIRERVFELIEGMLRVEHSQSATTQLLQEAFFTITSAAPTQKDGSTAVFETETLIRLASTCIHAHNASGLNAIFPLLSPISSSLAPEEPTSALVSLATALPDHVMRVLEPPMLQAMRTLFVLPAFLAATAQLLLSCQTPAETLWLIQTLRPIVPIVVKTPPVLPTTAALTTLLPLRTCLHLNATFSDKIDIEEVLPPSRLAPDVDQFSTFLMQGPLEDIAAALVSGSVVVPCRVDQDLVRVLLALYLFRAFATWAADPVGYLSTMTALCMNGYSAGWGGRLALLVALSPLAPLEAAEQKPGNYNPSIVKLLVGHGAVSVSSRHLTAFRKLLVLMPTIQLTVDMTKAAAEQLQAGGATVAAEDKVWEEIGRMWSGTGLDAPDLEVNWGDPRFLVLRDYGL